MRISPVVGRGCAFIAAVTVLVAGCGSDGDDGGGGSGSDSGARPASDRTFTTNIAADPGNLHPHETTLSAARGVISFMYDKLVYFTPDGEQQPWLAESWDVKPKSVTYTIRDGVTCSDGSPLTASDIKANFDFITKPANQSPVRGLLVPAEMDVTADDKARTVTVQVAEPDPFLLHTTGELFIACKAGLKDPAALKADGIGTGMYQLTDAVANDHYTFERRDDYAWGPGETTAPDAGSPKSITLRVVANESTAVNMFMADELNAVSAVGADRQRLEASHEQVTMRATVGELFFNQAADHPGADPEVRAALAQAVDFNELTEVITGGFGERSKSIAAIEPTACDYDAVDGNLPEPDPAAAAAALDAAGWTEGSGGVRQKDGEELSFELIYNSTRGDTTAAAAELIAERWTDVGVKATTRGMPPTEYNEVAFGSGAWDAALLPVNVRLPSQMVPFLSGTTPPDGLNLAHLENKDYARAVAEATELPAEESCAKWQEAEEALFAANDVILFADEIIPTFLNGVTMELGQDGIIPPTIRFVN